MAVEWQSSGEWRVASGSRVEVEWHSSGIGLAIAWLRACQAAAEWQWSSTPLVVKWHWIGNGNMAEWYYSGNPVTLDWQWIA